MWGVETRYGETCEIGRAGEEMWRGVARCGALLANEIGCDLAHYWRAVANCGVMLPTESGGGMSLYGLARSCKHSPKQPRRAVLSQVGAGT